MNERILEIAKLATQQYSMTYYPKEFMENFAKLIVRECVKIAHIHSEGSELHDEGTVYYYLEDIADKIKEHFGVE